MERRKGTKPRNYQIYTNSQQDKELAYAENQNETISQHQQYQLTLHPMSHTYNKNRKLYIYTQNISYKQ